MRTYKTISAERQERVTSQQTHMDCKKPMAMRASSKKKTAESRIILEGSHLRYLVVRGWQENVLEYYDLHSTDESGRKYKLLL